MLWIFRVVGKTICHLQNLLIITASTSASVWHRTRLCMVEGVDHQIVGQKSGIGPYLGLKLCRTLPRKSRLFDKGLKQLRTDKRIMQIFGEDLLSMRLVTMCSSAYL